MTLTNATAIAEYMIKCIVFALSVRKTMIKKASIRISIHLFTTTKLSTLFKAHKIDNNIHAVNNNQTFIVEKENGFMQRCFFLISSTKAKTPPKNTSAEIKKCRNEVTSLAHIGG